MSEKAQTASRRQSLLGAPQGPGLGPRYFVITAAGFLVGTVGFASAGEWLWSLLTAVAAFGAVALAKYEQKRLNRFLES